MKKRSPATSILLASCLILQGLLSWVVPLHSGMAMAAEPPTVEAAVETAPATPPCHQSLMAATEPAALDADDDHACCDDPASLCSSLCYWACAFSSGPPVSATLLSAVLPCHQDSTALETFPPWVPPIPTPPPISAAAALA